MLSLSLSLSLPHVQIVVLNCWKCNQCLKGHKSLGLLFEGVLQLSLSLHFSLSLSLSLSFCSSGYVSHHSDQKYQRSHYLGRSLKVLSNVFVIVFVFVKSIVIVFVVVFLLVRSCPLVTLITYLEGHKSLGLLFEGVL